MDLQDFVKSALLDIMLGIQSAQGDSKVGTSVAPARFDGLEFPESSGVISNNHTAMTAVQFDVSVTTETTASGEGGSKIRVYVFEVGAGAEASRKAQHVSRIKFSVPIKMPRAAQADGNDAS